MATKDAVLQALQNSEGAFLSGEELSNKLSVSRTTVWKAIKALREEGHPIEAVSYTHLAGKFPAAFLQVFYVWLDQCFSQSPALFQSFIIRHLVADNAFPYQ